MLPATPFKDRLSTNYVPSDNETTAIQKLIEVVEPQIVSLDAEIEAMKQRRAVYASFVADHRALISPIRRMPPDILRNVFSYCVPYDTPERSMQISSAPLLLTQICRHWRNLAIKTPTLWSTIFLRIPVPPRGRYHPSPLPWDAQEGDIDIEAEGSSDALSASLENVWRRKSESLISLTNMWLSRAEGCPLSIFFRDVDSDSHLPTSPISEQDSSLTQKPFDRLLSLICARSSQWARLDLKVPESGTSEETFLSRSPSQTPHLRAIRVQWSSTPPNRMPLSIHPPPPSQSHNPGTEKTAQKPSFHIFKATGLQHLSIDSFNGHFTDLSVAWSSLTELSYTGRPARYYGAHSPPSDRISHFPPSAALALLQNCPNLVKCELHLSELTFNSDATDQTILSNKVHLPHLARFVVFEHKQSPSLGFFKSLDLPFLSSISWSSTISPFSPGSPSPGPPHLSIYPLLATSGHQIQYLEIGTITTSVAQLVDTLKLAVGVKELTIDVSSVIFSIPSLSSMDDTAYVPPRPFYRDELLRRLTPSSPSLPEEILCPNLVILKLTLAEPLDITTKALKSLVAHRGVVESRIAEDDIPMHVVTPLEQVSVRFIHIGATSALPKRWEEDQLNSSFGRRTIKVERRKAIGHGSDGESLLYRREYPEAVRGVLGL
ncbi:hypothetical protein BKA70DRAFT_1398666 [Coprinopsis sp. MPI-PUGE-AT-0042]|nr:hypothetical protein BKA70DRAFT_1398666 [Coprinopsis sp. MPI-PUGE-AT-0042]